MTKAFPYPLSDSLAIAKDGLGVNIDLVDSLLSPQNKPTEIVAPEGMRPFAPSVLIPSIQGLEKYSDLDIPIQQSLATAASWLERYLSRDDFISTIHFTFGDTVDGNEAKQLIQQLAQSDPDVLPKIEVRPAAEIGGAMGAFAGSNNTIYLSREFLEQNSNNQGAIVPVLLEELGHSIDWKLHPGLDTPGDEGELFSDLVRGVALSEPELQRLKTKDDRVTVNLDGQVVLLEQATSIFLSNLPSVTGVFVDSQNNVLVSINRVNPQTYQLETLIAKYAPNGQLINAKIFGIHKIKMAADPSLGGAIGLQDDGLVFRLDPNTLTGYPLFNIRQIPVDTSAVYDYTTNQVFKPGTGVFPQSATYNDIAVRQNGGVTELFVTGDSIGSGLSPFIMRIRFENNTLKEAKVLISGHRAGIGSQLLAPGIAVNSQGKVITTLPRAGYGVNPIDLVSFSTDFNPDDGVQSQELAPLRSGIDSFGMTSDTSGNFYILLTQDPHYANQAGLLSIPPTLDLNNSQEQSLGTPGFDGLARGDVAIDPASQKAYITFNTSVIAVTDILPPNPTTLDTPLFRFQNTSIPGTYLFAGEQEAASIRQNYKNFHEEGFAFGVATSQTDPLLQPFYRFQNTSMPGTYLYAGEQEATSIRQNYKNFHEEGLAFYAYGAGAEKGTTFNRFQNTSLPGTYLFAGPSETASILTNYQNFHLEGKAFEAAG